MVLLAVFAVVGPRPAFADVLLGPGQQTSQDQGVPNFAPAWANNSLVGMLCGTRRGSTVIAAQTMLAAAGYLAAGGADGIAGERTHSAVVAWQEAHRLTGDGCVGPDTWDSMQGSDHREDRSRHPTLVYTPCGSTCQQALYDYSESTTYDRCIHSTLPSGYAGGKVSGSSYYVMLHAGEAFRTWNPGGHKACPASLAR